jgi:hypothetical protein
LIWKKVRYNKKYKISVLYLDFESNSTDPAPKPHLISTQKIDLNQSSIHEFNITLEDLDAGLNLTITVQ